MTSILSLAVALATVCAFLISSPRSAHAFTGLELLRQCEGREPEGRGALGEIICLAYLNGIIDGYQVGTIRLDATQRPLCPPADGIVNEQMKLIVEKWLRDHPGDLHLPARVLVVIALAQGVPLPTLELELAGVMWTLRPTATCTRG